MYLRGMNDSDCWRIQVKICSQEVRFPIMIWVNVELILRFCDSGTRMITRVLTKVDLIAAPQHISGRLDISVFSYVSRIRVIASAKC